MSDAGPPHAQAAEATVVPELIVFAMCVCDRQAELPLFGRIYLESKDALQLNSELPI
jgi:hypothetical protein